jgi:hypothetical protein
VKEFLAKSQVAKAELRLSERGLCRSLALARTTYRRWHRRERQGQEIIGTPGPKKTGPLPLEELNRQIAALPHRSHRTAGTTALRARYSGAISRRRFNGLVHQCRSEQRRQRRQALQHVKWQQPNLAWAIDAAEYLPDGQRQLLLFIAVEDLASEHRFTPLPALNLTGVQVAEHLHGLFKQYGPPLILKRDNGSIFNCKAVNELLAQWHVLPLNSPAYYPRYNGAIENAIREVKTDLPEVLPPPPLWEIQRVAPLLSAICLQQNTTPRRRLDGRTACEAYRLTPDCRFTKRQRMAIFQSILSDVRVKLSQMEKPDRRDFHATWRAATVHWLVCQNLISLSPKTKTVTPFSTNVGS